MALEQNLADRIPPTQHNNPGHTIPKSPLEHLQFPQL